MIAVSGVVTFLVPDHCHRLAGVRLFQLELRHADGSHELVTDQANPLHVGAPRLTRLLRQLLP